MAQRPGQRVYQSGAFEAIGLLGQLLIALPNLDLFAGAAALWLRVGGLLLATLYVCVLLLRGFLPDRVFEAGADAQGGVAEFQVKLRAGNRRVVVPVAMVAVLVAGISLFGASALGLNGDSVAPDAPARLRTTGATAQQIDLAWDEAADNGSGVREYRVVRRDNGLARTSTSTSFHDTMGISGGGTYEYQVTAVDGAGNVSRASEVKVTTPTSDAAACAADQTPPTQPNNLRTTVVTSTAVTLEWDAATDVGNCGLAGYHLLRDGQDTGLTAAGNTITEDGLEPDHSYVYTLVARDNAENRSVPSQAITVATLARPVQTQGPCAIGAPRALHVTGQNTTSVGLAWNPPDEKCQLDGYRIYRGGNLVGQTMGTTFTVSGLASSTTFVFTVRARNGDGEMSPSSNAVSATTTTPPPPPDSTPPTNPSAPILSWTRQSSTLSATWGAASDPESGIKWYEVYLNGVLKGTATALSYSIPSLSPYTSYTVGVRAVNNVNLMSATVTSTLTSGPGTAAFDASLSPDTIGTDVGGTVTVTGADATQGTTVDVSLSGYGSVTSALVQPDGTFSATFDLVADGSGNVVVAGHVLPDGPYFVDVTGAPGDGPMKSFSLSIVTPEVMPES